MKVTFKAVVVAALTMLLVGGGVAGAAKLITGKDVKNSSLTGSDIKNKSLTALDIKGSVKGAPGPAGPAGPAGAAGATGPAGPRGPITRVAGPITNIAIGAQGASTAPCEAGQIVTGGGYVSAGSGASVFASDSDGAPNSWTAKVDNTDATVGATIQAFAYCTPG